MLFCVNSALKQKTVHLSMACYVHSRKQKLAVLYIQIARQAVQSSEFYDFYSFISFISAFSQI
jgi:hypothetical protein